MRIDEEFEHINWIINDLYDSVEKEDDKEDYPFSILKMGLITWRYNVKKPNQKTLFKSVKICIK